MIAWFTARDRHTKVLLALLAVLTPLLVGMLVAERRQRLVYSNLECAPVPTDRLGKCPPSDDRPVLTHIVPTGRYGEPHWRVMSWDPRTGWDALYGTNIYRVHDWIELPEAEQ